MGQCPLRLTPILPLIFTQMLRIVGVGHGRRMVSYGYWASPLHRCTHYVFPPTFDDIPGSNIIIKELCPVVAAIHRLGKKWSHRNILLHTDNTQVMYMVLSGRSSNVDPMNLIRELLRSIVNRV